MTRRATSAPTSLTIAEARANLAEVVRRAERGEEVQITRRGVPVAVVSAARTDEEQRGARFRALVARMCSEAEGDDGPENPWADVRDPSPGRPAPNFGR